MKMNCFDFACLRFLLLKKKVLFCCLLKFSNQIKYWKMWKRLIMCKVKVFIIAYNCTEWITCNYFSYYRLTFIETTLRNYQWLNQIEIINHKLILTLSSYMLLWRKVRCIKLCYTVVGRDGKACTYTVECGSWKCGYLKLCKKNAIAWGHRLITSAFFADFPTPLILCERLSQT